MRSFILTFNVTLRAVMEAGIIFAAGYWGYQAGSTPFTKILLMIITPVFLFGFWGLVDFHKAGKFGESFRLVEELFITGLAAILLFISGARILGLILAIISVIHHVLVYLLGERLLKN